MITFNIRVAKLYLMMITFKFIHDLNQCQYDRTLRGRLSYRIKGFTETCSMSHPCLIVMCSFCANHSTEVPPALPTNIVELDLGGRQ